MLVRRFWLWLIVILIFGIIVNISGCGGSSGSSSTKSLFEPQSGTQTYLFYGEVNHKSLGSIKNLRVIDVSDPSKILFSCDNTTAVRYPAATSVYTYSPSDKTYKDLYVKYVSYVANGKAYSVPLIKTNSTPNAVQNSVASNLVRPSYVAVHYLGIKQYLTAKDTNGNYILITPDMGPADSPILLGDKAFLTVTYPSYGQPIDGYLVYDYGSKTIQKCSLDMSSCTDIVKLNSKFSSYSTFKGDIEGTIYSLIQDGNNFYRIDKAQASVDNISLGSVGILVAHGSTALQGNSFYYVGVDHNLYRVNLLDNTVIKLTPYPDPRLERIRSFTKNWVIYGSDVLLEAVKKDGSSKEPVLLAETSPTYGYKYVINYGMKDIFLYELYKINPVDSTVAYKDTSYTACVFNDSDGSVKCKDNSFWAGVDAAKNGTLCFEAKYPLTPYAIFRVDDTDDFGGGTIKAVKPSDLFGEGITIGSIPKYNFQTFISNSRYFTQNVDSDGGIVLYAKNDSTFHVDSFYLNILKKDSLAQLTDTNPFPDVTHGLSDHCHGRVCMICHNFAGGKIYKDLKGTRSAYGYKVELEFMDGSSVVAKVAKGKGENFCVPLNEIKGDFKPVVLDANGNIVNSAKDYHKGIYAANCNYCHARGGVTRFGAPGVITIVNTDNLTQ